MRDKNGIPEPQNVADFHEIRSIARQGCVLLGTICSEIGSAGAHMIEQDDFEAIFKLGSYEASHLLVASETVSENHGRAALAR